MARLDQIVLALVFLTRLPLGRFLPPRVLSLAAAAWAFPLAGAVIGLLAGLPLWIGAGLLPAALAVCMAVWLTAALHEDALADFADAGGGRDRDSRLRIMRDSTIGSYGAMALICATALRVAALAVLGPGALIAAAAAGRVAPVMLMRALPPARAEGLGHGAGRPSRRAVVGAAVIGGIILLAGAPGPLAALTAAAGIGLSVVGVSRRACRLVGGQTGDVLGASALIAETVALVAMTLWIAPTP